MVQTMFRRMSRLALCACGCLIAAGAASAQYSENFDSTPTGTLPTGWTSATTGIPGWTVVSDFAHSGSNSLWIDEPVSVAATATLTFPPITAAGPVTLEFWNRYATLDGRHAFAVFVSINGGAFANVGQAAWRQNGYNAQIAASTSPLNTQRAFAGTFLSWTRRIASVSAAPGDIVVFQIVFGCSSAGAVEPNGIWIDDIAVTTSALGACCLADGSCIFDTPANCADQGGTFNSAASCASAVCLRHEFAEVEPNDTKDMANVVNLVNQGDHITGTCTGSATSGGATNTYDCFLVKTPPMPPGIYRHRLVSTTTTAPSHMGHILGREQVPANPEPWTGVSNGIAGADERNVQSSVTFYSSPPRMNQWYGFGLEELIYYRVGGVSTTSAPYRAVWTMQQITPTEIGSFRAGQITISTVDQGHTSNTDMWVYSIDGDGHYTAIPGYGNDNASTDGGATTSSNRSFLRRTYAPGTYCLALSQSDMCNNMGSPSDDNNRTGMLMEFPNSIASFNADNNVNVSFAVIDSAGTLPVPAVRAEAFDINWYRFTVVAVGACCAADGGCASTTEGGCTAGFYQGDGSVCEPNTCPVGAVTCCRGTTCQAGVAAAACTGVVAGSSATAVASCTGNTFAGCCFGDYDHNGTKDITDIFTFLNAWFSSSVYADITDNGASAPDITDIFTFLNAWFGSCE